MEKDGTITFRLGGTVIGEFVCDTYVTDKTFGHDALFNAAACMDEDDAADYANGSPLYGWHISDLVIYDEPKELGEYRRVCINDLYCDSCAMYWNNGGNCGNESLRLKRPPQSWCYVQEESLQVISEFGPACLCIAATSPDGETFTGYYNADATDKAVFAHHIQSDVTMDIIRENIETIKRLIEEVE